MRTVRVNLSPGRYFLGMVVEEGGPYTTVVVTDSGTVNETVGRHVLCAPRRIQEITEPLKGWVSFHVVVPVGEMSVIDASLHALGFQENDWCEYSRSDGAIVTYGPCEAPHA